MDESREGVLRQQALQQDEAARRGTARNHAWPRQIARGAAQVCGQRLHIIGRSEHGDIAAARVHEEDRRGVIHAVVAAGQVHPQEGHPEAVRHGLHHRGSAGQADEVRVEGMDVLRQLRGRVACRIHADEHHAQPRHDAGFHHLRQLQQRHRAHIRTVGVAEVHQRRRALADARR